MVIFERNVQTAAISFCRRETIIEMIECLEQAEYYEKLARKFKNRECWYLANDFIKRFNVLCETPEGISILKTHIFEKRGTTYCQVPRPV